MRKNFYVADVIIVTSSVNRTQYFVYYLLHQ